LYLILETTHISFSYIYIANFSNLFLIDEALVIVILSVNKVFFLKLGDKKSFRGLTTLATKGTLWLTFLSTQGLL